MWSSRSFPIVLPRVVAAAAVLASTGGTVLPAAPSDVARRAGLRVVESRHLTLITDRPPREGDGIEDLPRLFDDAFVVWCRHYGIEPGEHAEWRATGCLMTDRERFRAVGLLPADGSVPDFENGFCVADRFWLMDQSNPDYRRHLLLHEGVHAFTLTVRGADAPPWYTEGIAEYLATHRLDRDGGEAVFAWTPIPARPDDVEQLGRIERIGALRRDGIMPGLGDVFALQPQAHSGLGAYAASWAAVAFLAGHPSTRTAFEAAERGPLDRGLTTRLTAGPGWDGQRAERDFDAFTAEIDYGFDFERTRIDWSPGKPLAARQELMVAADRGWQNSGWSLTKDQRCSFNASGRVSVGKAFGSSHADTTPVVLESPPDGITLRWHRGRPVGRLLIAQWVEPDDGTRPCFQVLAEGESGTIDASTSGPLYLKVNERPGDLADNTGLFGVFLAP